MLKQCFRSSKAMVQKDKSYGLEVLLMSNVIDRHS